MLKKVCLLSAAVPLLAALGFGVKTASAGKPTFAVPVTVEFRDAAGDQITSDGAGPYVDGQQGVEANIYTSTGDQRLNLNRSSRKTFVVPVGEATFLNVGIGSGDLLAMEPGDEERVSAFLVVEDGVLRFQPEYELAEFGTSGSTQITVECTAQDEWMITAEPDDIAVLIQAVQQGGKGKKVPTPVGYFPLPFQLTVTAM